METVDATRRTLEERIRSLELENRQYDPKSLRCRVDLLFHYFS